MWGRGISEIGREVLLVELRDTVPPGPGEVLLAVEAAGVGPWDEIVRTGGWDVGLRAPAALGVEGAGTVMAVGDGVTGVAVGDEVLAHANPLPGGSGFWAERVLVDAAHLAHRPAGLEVVQAAALPVGGLTAAQALEALAVQHGERLLISGGAGGTGALAVQLAYRMGAAVTATASRRQRMRVRALGASSVLDYADPEWPRRANGPFDAALVAARGTAQAAMDLLRDGGRLCVLTSDAPTTQRGIRSENLYVRPDGAVLAVLAELVAKGALRLSCEVVPFSEGSATLARVAAGRAGGRKWVLAA